MKEPLLNFDKFKVGSQASDLIQIYVTRENHTWIKKMGQDNGVKMAYVISELVRYADMDKEVFLHILRLLKELAIATATIPIDYELRKRVNKMVLALEGEE